MVERASKAAEAILEEICSTYGLKLGEVLQSVAYPEWSGGGWCRWEDWIPQTAKDNWAELPTEAQLLAFLMASEQADEAAGADWTGPYD